MNVRNSISANLAPNLEAIIEDIDKELNDDFPISNLIVSRIKKDLKDNKFNFGMSGSLTELSGEWGGGGVKIQT